jgi:hypothetical protein
VTFTDVTLMQRLLPAIRFLGVALALSGCAKPDAHPAATAGPDVTGSWRVTITAAEGTITGVASLRQTGDEVTGWLGPDENNPIPVTGVLKGNRLTMKTSPQPGRTVAFDTCELTVNAERLLGTIQGGDTHKGTIELVRNPL